MFSKERTACIFDATNQKTIEEIKNKKNALPDCMSRTYCPPFGIVVAHLALILFSLGMLADISHIISEHATHPVPPMTYFIILAFVTVIALSALTLIHMLFVKRMLIPPPCLT
jgi:hypothetical protein